MTNTTHSPTGGAQIDLDKLEELARDIELLGAWDFDTADTPFRIAGGEVVGGDALPYGDVYTMREWEGLDGSECITIASEVGAEFGRYIAALDPPTQLFDAVAGKQAGDAAQFFIDANKLRISELEELNRQLKMKAAQFADEAFKAEQRIADLRAQLASAEHGFKNFHSQLCARFGYTHDERDWKRDQVSLIEFIAAQLASAQKDAENKGERK